MSKAKDFEVLREQLSLSKEQASQLTESLIQYESNANLQERVFACRIRSLDAIKELLERVSGSSGTSEAKQFFYTRIALIYESYGLFDLIAGELTGLERANTYYARERECLLTEINRLTNEIETLKEMLL